MLYEMCGASLGFHDRLTVCVGAGVPVPLADSVVVEGCASLEHAPELQIMAPFFASILSTYGVE